MVQGDVEAGVCVGEHPMSVGCYCEKSKNGCVFLLLKKQTCDLKRSPNANWKKQHSKNNEAKEHHYDYAHDRRCRHVQTGCNLI